MDGLSFYKVPGQPESAQIYACLRLAGMSQFSAFFLILPRSEIAISS
jgi:hypothetical protein